MKKLRYYFAIPIFCLASQSFQILHGQDLNEALSESNENINDSQTNIDSNNFNENILSDDTGSDNLGNFPVNGNQTNSDIPSNGNDPFVGEAGVNPLGNEQNNGLGNFGNDKLSFQNNTAASNATNGLISNDSFIFDDGQTQSNIDGGLLEENDIFSDQQEVNQSIQTTDQAPTGVRVLEQIEEPNLFSGAPPVPGTMKILAQNEAPEDYRVQPGDTLFDICDQLIDEPSYWPKLWSFNAFIRNPHFIFPGMVLRFYPGGENTPPFLRVVSEDDIVPVDKDLLSDKFLQIDPKDFLNGEGSFSPIPVIGPGEINPFPEIDEAFISIGGVFVPERLSLTLPAFIVQQEIQELGVVAGNSEGNTLLDDLYKVVVEAGDSSLTTGTVYSILRYSGEVDNPTTGDFAGYRYEFVGHVKITDTLAGGSFAGDIVLDRAGVQTGDIIAPFRSVKRTAPYKDAAVQVGGFHVVGFEEPMMQMAGIGSFVFLNAGQGSSGLTPGQTIRIYQSYTPLGTLANSAAGMLVEDIADVHILDLTDAVATGYVIAGRKEVRLGDPTASQAAL